MSRFIHATSLVTCVPAMLLLALSGAAAQPTQAPAAVSATPGSDAAVRAYWTPERILNAKSADAMVNGPRHAGRTQKTRAEAPQIFHGTAPEVGYDPSLAVKLYDETQQVPRGHPPLSGTGNLPFTTNRLYPTKDTVLYKVFPYATVGHLLFSEPGGDFQCSASVIRANTIATAGHCVNDGNGHYYTNWMFIPAANGSAAPYGTWTWSKVITTSAWFGGGGGVPNEQDDAIIVLKKNSHGFKISHYTGNLGYEFNASLPTAISQLGYPCNLDSCSDPIATYSQDTQGPTNNFEWGTASFGGASGGPEIQDFGQAPSGVPSETFGGNVLVSSTSYTYTDTSVEVDGGSIFYSPGQNGEYTMGDLINYACAHGGC